MPTAPGQGLHTSTLPTRLPAPTTTAALPCPAPPPPNHPLQYVVEVEKAADGTLTPKSQQWVDWSALGGLWIPCAGSLSPWNTHIGGEEYEPNARPFSEVQ